MTREALTITRVAFSVLAAPVHQPVPMSFGQLRDRRVCVVEVEAGGYTGVGESWINYPAWAHEERMATYVEGVAPVLLGLDAGDPVAVQRVLLDALGPVGRQSGAPGPIWQALSGVDIALWDLRGQAAGVPIHALLGGDRSARQVPAYASGIGPDDVESLCDRANALGLSTLKAKIGFGRDTDADTLSRIRSAAPDDAVVLADANQAWDHDTAVDMLGMLQAYDVQWLEEPLAGDAVDDLAKLASVSPIALVSGENVYGLDQFRARVDSGALRYVQPDLAKSGGFTIANDVARRAYRSPVRLAPHCYSSALGLLAALQLAAAWTHVETIEFDVRDNPLRTDLLDTPLHIADGALSVPTGPGLGRGLNRDLVDDLRTRFDERNL